MLTLGATGPVGALHTLARARSSEGVFGDLPSRDRKEASEPPLAAQGGKGVTQVLDFWRDSSEAFYLFGSSYDGSHAPAPGLCYFEGSETFRCVAVLLFFFPSYVSGRCPASSKAQKAYREGLRSEDAEQWKEAEKSYSDAIQNDAGDASYYQHRAKVRCAWATTATPSRIATRRSGLRPATRLRSRCAATSIARSAIPARRWPTTIERSHTSWTLPRSTTAARQRTEPGRERPGPRRLHARNQAAPGRSRAHPGSRDRVRQHGPVS